MLDEKSKHKALAWRGFQLLKFDFEIVHQPSAYHQTFDAMSRIPNKNNEEELAVINEDIPTLNLEHVEKCKTAPVMSLSQSFLSMPTKVETIEAQHQDQYCRNLQIMVGSDPTRSFNKNGWLCRGSAVIGDTKKVSLKSNEARYYTTPIIQD